MPDTQTSIKVYFNKVVFFGKPCELSRIIQLIQREAFILNLSETIDEEKLFNLIMDLHTARTAHALATGKARPQQLIHRDDVRLLFPVNTILFDN